MFLFISIPTVDFGLTKMLIFLDQSSQQMPK